MVHVGVLLIFLGFGNIDSSVRGRVCVATMIRVFAKLMVSMNIECYVLRNCKGAMRNGSVARR